MEARRHPRYKIEVEIRGLGRKFLRRMRTCYRGQRIRISALPAKKCRDGETVINALARLWNAIGYSSQPVDAISQA